MQTTPSFNYFKRYSNLTVLLSSWVNVGNFAGPKKKKIQLQKPSKRNNENLNGLCKFSLLNGWGQVWHACDCTRAQAHTRTHIGCFLPLQHFYFRYSNLNPSFLPCHLFDSAANVA